MRKFNYVYVTTNINNKKQYIGDHSADDLNDDYLGSGDIIKYAIKKYGKENFKREILEQFDTKKEAFDAQEKYINKFNTLKPNGYNISPKGGLNVKECFSEESIKKMKKNRSGIPSWCKGLTKEKDERVNKLSKKLKGKKKSKEHAKKIAESLKGKSAWNRGKKNIYSNETLIKMSNSASIRTGEKNAFFGKHHTEETKIILREKSKINNAGEKNGMSGKHHTKEAKEKIGKVHKGKKLSDETKKKLKELTSGELNGNSKLKLEEVKQIKQDNILSKKELAIKFNVSISTIDHIKRGISWKNVF